MQFASLARLALSFVLSLALVITPHTAAAVGRLASPEELQQISEFLEPQEREALRKIVEQIQGLQTSFALPQGPQHPLDDFDILQQDVIDQRKIEINSKIRIIEEKDFEQRRNEDVDFLLEQARKNHHRTIEYIGHAAVRIAADRVGLDPKTDLAALIEMARTNDDIAKLFGIEPDNIEHFVDDNLPPRRLYKMNLKVNVVKIQEIDGETHETAFQTLRQKDSEGSTSVSFSEPVFLNTPKDGEFRFDITTHTGEVIYRFNRPVSAVGFYGRFLIYADKADAVAEGGEAATNFPLRFIDLDYFKAAIGNTPLPAFSLPVLGQGLEHLSLKEGQVVVNNKPLPYAVFTFAADLFQVYYNIKVALLDPRTVGSAANLIKDLVYYKDQSMQQMDDLQSEMIRSAVDGMESFDNLVENMQTKLEAQVKIGPTGNAANIPEKVREGLRDQPEMMITFNPTINVIQNEVLNQTRLQQVNRSMMTGRQFFSRMHLLMAKVIHPQPMGTPKIVQGLAMLAESSLAGKWDIAAKNWEEIKAHPVIGYGRFGAGALAAAALGTQISEEFAFALFDSLQTGKNQIVGYLEHTDYGRNFVRLMGSAGSTAAAGVPGVANYFNADAGGRVAVLGAAMMGLIISIYGTLHLTANTIGTYRYFARHQNWIQKARQQGASRLGAYKQAFVKYQNALRLYYDRALSAAEAKTNKNTANVRFNRAQNEVAAEVLADLQNKSGGLLGRVSSSFEGAPKAIEKQTAEMSDAGDKAHVYIESLKKHTHLNTITTVRAALAQFALSYPSALITSRFGGGLWNYWFMIRSFSMAPKSWPMFLTYPEMFRVGIDGQDGRLHMPSRMNGGRRSILENIRFTVKNWSSDVDLDDLRAFEKAMLPIEAIAYEVSLEKALEALIQEVKDPKQLKEFFDSTALAGPNIPHAAIMEGASPSTGIRSISDPKIKKLSAEGRSFFRATFNQLYESTTEIYVRRYVENFVPGAKDTQTIEDLKEIGLQATGAIQADVTKIKGHRALHVQKEIQKIAAQLMEDGRIVGKARQLSSSYAKVGQRFLLNAEHDVVAKLDPRKPQIGRFKTAEKQLGNMKAVVRAMNAVATEVLAEKMVGLATIFVMYSAVTEGVLRPLHPEMFGPDSWFYGSRYLFLNGFISGVVIASLASVWMKVQVDQRIDSAGGFDKVPTAIDRDKNYFRYYLKSFFKNPANKWSSNQLHNMKLVWANLSAAFVTIAATNFLTLGRFDLGAFIAGYIVVFLTPLSGIDLKIDQTHELASRWQASQVNRRLRSHPKIQEWINKNVLKKRFPHTYGAATYGFFMGPFISLFEMMDTPQFGKRSFMNLLFNGYQPEEIISKGLQTVNKYLGAIPGVQSVTSFCESLLTNNNTSLDPSKLINPPVKVPTGGN